MSRTFAANACARVAPRLVLEQQIAVLFERRAAAGRIDEDRVDLLALEARDERAREVLGLIGPAAVQRKRTAAALPARHDDFAAFRAEHANRRGVHAREERALHAARDQRDARAPLALREREIRQRRERVAQLDRRRHRDELPQPQGQELAERPRDGARQAELRAEPQSRNHRAQPLGIRKQREHELAERAIAGRSRDRVFDFRAGRFDQKVVANARRARGNARHAAQTRIDVARRRASSSGMIPSSTPFIKSMRPRGESISSPHETYVGHAGKQNPQCTQSEISESYERGPACSGRIRRPCIGDVGHQSVVPACRRLIPVGEPSRRQGKRPHCRSRVGPTPVWGLRRALREDCDRASHESTRGIPDPSSRRRTLHRPGSTRNMPHRRHTARRGAPPSSEREGAGRGFS